MNLDWINGASRKELDDFKTVCNQLLSRTYIVRTVYKPGGGRVTNPNYIFLAAHYEEVRDYLSLLDWDLRKDDRNGYFYILNTDEANRCILDKKKRRRSCLLSGCSTRKIWSISVWNRTPSARSAICWKKW